MGPRKTLESSTSLLAHLETLQPFFHHHVGSIGLQVDPKIEHTLHECCHMVTLGVKWPARATLAWRAGAALPDLTAFLEDTLSALTPEEQCTNEIRTLAAEILLLRQLHAFDRANGEWLFLKRIADLQKSNRARLLQRVPEAVRSVESFKASERVRARVIAWTTNLSKPGTMPRHDSTLRTAPRVVLSDRAD
jgi:hypothetical protein